MAYLLGEMKRSFENGLDPCTVENYDECHFLMDSDDNRCLEFEGSKGLTYAEIASAGQRFTVFFRISRESGRKIRSSSLYIPKFKCKLSH